MKLIGSKVERAFRDILISSHKALVQDNCLSKNDDGIGTGKSTCAVFCFINVRKLIMI